MLKVANHFPNQLVLKLKIFLFRQQKWVDDDVFPVEAGLSGFEIWKDIVTSIGLKSWTLQTK
jgi:hypothetical protein